MWHCLREGVLEASSEQNWDRANHRLQPKGVWGEESIAPKGATNFTRHDSPFAGPDIQP